MPSRSFRITSRLFAVSLLLLPATACSDDDETGPNDSLEGTWDVQSFTGGGQDFIALGMQMSIELDATSSTGGTFELTIVNDGIDACDPGPNCNQTGNWTATSSSITINSGTVDATTFAYVRTGDQMTWTGTIDLIPVTVVLERQ